MQLSILRSIKRSIKTMPIDGIASKNITWKITVLGVLTEIQLETAIIEKILLDSEEQFT
jgi:hypothetical protein